MSEASETHFFKIGNLKITPKTNKIESPDGSNFLTPRLMRLLVFFLERPNRIVSKEDLLEKVWEDRLVTDNLLTKSISELRNFVEKNLPEIGEIQTIRSVGYQFRCDASAIFRGSETAEIEIFPIERATTLTVFPAEILENTAPTTPPKTNFSESKTGWFLLAAAAIALAGWLIFQHFSKSAPPLVATILPATSDQGLEINPSISPDGKFMAFAVRRESSPFYHVFVKNLGSSDGRLLSEMDSVFEFNPCWSPDGRRVAFFRRNQKRVLEIVAAPAMGGAETVFGQVEFSEIGGEVIWTAADALIFSGKKTAADPFQIHRFDLEKRQLEILTQPPSHIFGDQFPCLLPDNQLVFMRLDLAADRLATRSAGGGQLFQLNLKTGAEKFLAKAENEITALAWSPAQKMLFAWEKRREQGDYALFAWLPDGRQKMVSMVDHFRPRNLAAHPFDGSLFFEAWDAQTDIFEWRAGLPEPRLAISSTHWDWHPRFFDGGRRISFLSDRSGSPEIWFADAAAPEKTVQISNFGSGQIFWQSPSASGDSILLHAKFDEREGIFLFENFGKKLTPLLGGSARFAHPEWSPDGKNFYFSSDRGGAWEIWQGNFSENLDKNFGQKTTDFGGTRAIPFENQMLVFSGADNDLHLLDLATHRRVLFLEGKNYRPAKANFCATAGAAFFEKWEAGVCHLVSVDDLLAIDLKKLCRLRNVIPDLPGLAVSPDGRRVFVTQSAEISVDLMEARFSTEK